MPKLCFGLLIVSAVFVATLLPAVASDAKIEGSTKFSAWTGPKSLDAGKPFTRVESATCICDGIPFQASCPGKQKVTCKCGPPGYSCSN
jgi:hypothetical protein